MISASNYNLTQHTRYSIICFKVYGAPNIQSTMVGAFSQQNRHGLHPSKTYGIVGKTSEK